MWGGIRRRVVSKQQFNELFQQYGGKGTAGLRQLRKRALVDDPRPWNLFRSLEHFGHRIPDTQCALLLYWTRDLRWLNPSPERRGAIDRFFDEMVRAMMAQHNFGVQSATQALAHYETMGHVDKAHRVIERVTKVLGQGDGSGGSGGLGEAGQPQRHHGGATAAAIVPLGTEHLAWMLRVAASARSDVDAEDAVAAVVDELRTGEYAPSRELRDGLRAVARRLPPGHDAWPFVRDVEQASSLRGGRSSSPWLEWSSAASEAQHNPLHGDYDSNWNGRSAAAALCRISSDTSVHVEALALDEIWDAGTSCLSSGDAATLAGQGLSTLRPPDRTLRVQSTWTFDDPLPLQRSSLPRAVVEALATVARRRDAHAVLRLVGDVPNTVRGILGRAVHGRKHATEQSEWLQSTFRRRLNNDETSRTTTHHSDPNVDDTRDGARRNVIEDASSSSESAAHDGVAVVTPELYHYIVAALLPDDVGSAVGLVQRMGADGVVPLDATLCLIVGALLREAHRDAVGAAARGVPRAETKSAATSNTNDKESATTSPTLIRGSTMAAASGSSTAALSAVLLRTLLDRLSRREAANAAVESHEFYPAELAYWRYDDIGLMEAANAMLEHEALVMMATALPSSAEGLRRVHELLWDVVRSIDVDSRTTAATSGGESVESKVAKASTKYAAFDITELPALRPSFAAAIRIVACRARGRTAVQDMLDYVASYAPEIDVVTLGSVPLFGSYTPNRALCHTEAAMRDWLAALVAVGQLAAGASPPPPRRDAPLGPSDIILVDTSFAEVAPNAAQRLGRATVIVPFFVLEALQRSLASHDGSARTGDDVEEHRIAMEALAALAESVRAGSAHVIHFTEALLAFEAPELFPRPVPGRLIDDDAWLIGLAAMVAALGPAGCRVAIATADVRLQNKLERVKAERGLSRVGIVLADGGSKDGLDALDGDVAPSPAGRPSLADVVGPVVMPPAAVVEAVGRVTLERRQRRPPPHLHSHSIGDAAACSSTLAAHEVGAQQEQDGDAVEEFMPLVGDTTDPASASLRGDGGGDDATLTTMRSDGDNKTAATDASASTTRRESPWMALLREDGGSADHTDDDDAQTPSRNGGGVVKSFSTAYDGEERRADGDRVEDAAAMIMRGSTVTSPLTAAAAAAMVFAPMTSVPAIDVVRRDASTRPSAVAAAGDDDDDNATAVDFVSQFRQTMDHSRTVVASSAVANDASVESLLTGDGWGGVHADGVRRGGPHRHATRRGMVRCPAIDQDHVSRLGHGYKSTMRIRREISREARAPVTTDLTYRRFEVNINDPRAAGILEQYKEGIARKRWRVVAGAQERRVAQEAVTTGARGRGGAGGSNVIVEEPPLSFLTEDEER